MHNLVDTKVAEQSAAFIVKVPSYMSAHFGLKRTDFSES
jgi:hypothetical protein